MTLLLVVGLVSTQALRSAKSAAHVVDNSRAHAEAREAAQRALRWCEDALPAVAVAAVGPPDGPAGQGLWAQASWWNDPAVVHVLTPDRMPPGRTASRPPECMAESGGVRPSGAYTVTARGFSDDSVFDPATGLQLRGARVWVQSIVRLAAELGGAPTGGPASDPPDDLEGPDLDADSDCVPGPSPGPVTESFRMAAGSRICERAWRLLITPPF